MIRYTRTVTVEGSPDAIAAWRAMGYRAYVDHVGVPQTQTVGLPGRSEVVDVLVTDAVTVETGDSDATGVPV